MEGGRSAAFLHLEPELSLIIISPRFAVSPGFLLSVAATAALIWAAPRVVQKFVQFGLPRVASEVLAVTVVAASSTLPLSLYLFGTASVLGVLANIIGCTSCSPSSPQSVWWE
ncbi:MAG: ComEC/Rec2 family competence protein [Lawsonella clevelandensis]